MSSPAPGTMIVDELVVSIRRPVDLSPSEVDAVRRGLEDAAFLETLDAAVRAAVGRFPALAPLTVSVSR